MIQIYQKGPVVDFLESSRWMRAASRMGFDCEGNQFRFLTDCDSFWCSLDELKSSELYTTNAPRPSAPRTSREELGVCETRLQVLYEFMYS